jgi:hypothetical protein
VAVSSITGGIKRLREFAGNVASTSIVSGIAHIIRGLAGSVTVLTTVIGTIIFVGSAAFPRIHAVRPRQRIQDVIARERIQSLRERKRDADALARERMQDAKARDRIQETDREE